MRGLAVLAMLCFALPRAEAVFVTFSGVITEATFTNNNPGLTIFPTLPAVGTPFTGSFSYAVPLGVRTMSIGITIGTHPYFVVGSFPQFTNGDLVDTINASGDAIVGQQVISIHLIDPTGQAFQPGDPAVPTSLNAADWTTGSMQILDRSWTINTLIAVHGTVGASVPDSGSTALMLGAAFAALAGLGRWLRFSSSCSAC